MPEFIAICRYIDGENGDAECVSVLYDADNMNLWNRVDDLYRRDRRYRLIEAEYYHREGGNYMKGA